MSKSNGIIITQGPVANLELYLLLHAQYSLCQFTQKTYSRGNGQQITVVSNSDVSSSNYNELINIFNESLTLNWG